MKTVQPNAIARRRFDATRPRIAIAVLALLATLAQAATDPIPALVAAQTVTRTTPNTASDLTNASLLGNGDVLVSTYGGPASLGFDVSKVDFWKDGTRDLVTGTVYNATPLRVGAVLINIPALDGASYSQVQDPYNAEVRSTFVKGSLSIVERSRVFAQSQNILATDVTNNSASAVQVTVQTLANTSYADAGASTSAGAAGDVAWTARIGPTGLGFGPQGNAFRMRGSLSTRIVGATATVTTDAASTAMSTFTIPAGATVTVVTQIASTGGDLLTNDPADPVPAANAAVQQIGAQALATLSAGHSSWWSDFWHASSVQLTDEPLLMRYYYGALYVLASSNRAGKFAPGLYGWNGTDTPQWNGSYAMNYNIQAPYYGVYSSNHPELARSYYKSITSINDEHGKSYAIERGFTGTYFRSMYGIQGIRAEALSNPDWGQKTNALESAINFLKDYRYTLDTATLQNVSYPFLIEVANFWDDYLVKDANGRYVVNDSNVAEKDYSHAFNITTALAYLRAFYSGMLSASADLSVDDTRRAKWQDILNNLAAYTTVGYGGKSVFSFSEDNSSAEANSYPYNLYAVHPADQVGEGSPLAAVARNTIATRSYWTQGNSFPQIYPAAVKVGYPASEVVSQMNSLLGRMGQNNFYRQSGGGIETVGALEAVNSMLLSSTEGVIKFFPNWTEKDASYTSLGAVGAFTASAAMAGGIVQSASIASNKGRTATVRNPWPGKDLVVTTADGGLVSATRNAGHYSFPTVVGTKYLFTPSGGVPTTANPSLSVYKDASASSSVESGPWSAAAAIDGDTRSVTGSLGWSSAGSTNVNHTESFTVDLRVPQVISSVQLAPRGDAGQIGAGFPIDFDISLSSDGTTWSTVVSQTGVARPSVATPIKYTVSPQSAQFIKITGKSLRANPSDGNKYRMQLAEVSAFGAISITKTATVSATSSVESGPWGVARVINGSTASTGSDAGWSSSSNTANNHTEGVTIDLGSTQSLSAVVLYPRNDGANAGYGMPVEYTVSVSADGSSWTTVATRTGQALSSTPQTVSFAAQQARYVKVTGTSLRANPNDANQYRMQLAEISVFSN